MLCPFCRRELVYVTTTSGEYIPVVQTGGIVDGQRFRHGYMQQHFNDRACPRGMEAYQARLRRIAVISKAMAETGAR